MRKSDCFVSPVCNATTDKRNTRMYVICVIVIEGQIYSHVVWFIRAITIYSREGLEVLFLIYVIIFTLVSLYLYNLACIY